MKPSTLKTRRSLFYLCALSMLIFLLSCFFLLRSSSSSLIQKSLPMLMSVYNTSTLKAFGHTDRNKLPHISSMVSPPVVHVNDRSIRNGGGVGQPFNSNKEIRNSKRRTRQGCEPNRALLKVYMYDLSPMFHFGLLGWKGNGGQVWPDVTRIDGIPPYPGGLNLQHSVEYWLTLDLLSSNIRGLVRPCTVVRVAESSLADVIFVPFFSSVSYNRHSKLHGKEKVSRNKFLQDELVKFLTSQDEWKRSGGKNHVIVAHHPNCMLDVRRKLGSAMFVLADFGRYLVEIANIKKDIIAPYRHVVNSISNESATFEARPILVYFQGAIYRKDGGVIRQELYYLLKDEKDVHFAFGSAQGDGISRAGKGMASSRFCLNIAGDTPSSNRLFDAIASHCVPVIISDDIELPFEDVLDYTEFCIFLRASDAVKKGFLVNLLRGISRDEWTNMWLRLKQVSHHFEYQYPSQHNDAIQMIWQAVARKISSVKLILHKENRFRRSWQMVHRNQGEGS